MRNCDSPYLSWLVEEFCHRMLKDIADATLDADMDGKARDDILARLVGNGLYDSAIRCFSGLSNLKHGPARRDD